MLPTHQSCNRRGVIIQRLYGHCKLSYTPSCLTVSDLSHVGGEELHDLSLQANYTDRMSDRRLSVKLVPTLVDRGCRMVSTIPPVVNFGFLDQGRYFLEIAPQLSSRG
jgi:hypothetical protein